MTTYLGWFIEKKDILLLLSRKDLEGTLKLILS